LKILALINYVDRSHCSPDTIRKMEHLFTVRRVPFRIVKFTSREEAVTAMEKGRVEGFDTLIMGGGDGTVHNLFNDAFDKGFSFGVIPMGTVNALAVSLNIPHDPLEACRVVLEGRIRKIDVGRAAGRLFTCFASVGYDASVVHTIDQQSKIRWKRAAFFIQGLRRLARLKELRSFRVKIPPSKKRMRGYSLIISNIRHYAGFDFFSEEPDDGKMGMVLMRKNTPLDYIRSVGKMFFTRKKKVEHDPLIYRSEIIKLTLKSRGHLFLQLDGEPIPLEKGRRVTFEILPHAAAFHAPK